MKPKKILSMYDDTFYDGPENQLVFKETETQQQFRDECDINNIMAKYDKTGMINHVKAVQGQYGDFTNVGSFQEAYQAVIQAEESFMALPAHIRKEFDNDPAVLMEFMSKEENKDEAIALGIVATPKDYVSPQQKQQIAAAEAAAKAAQSAPPAAGQTTK